MCSSTVPMKCVEISWWFVCRSLSSCPWDFHQRHWKSIITQRMVLITDCTDFLTISISTHFPRSNKMRLCVSVCGESMKCERHGCCGCQCKSVEPIFWWSVRCETFNQFFVLFAFFCVSLLMTQLHFSTTATVNGKLCHRVTRPPRTLSSAPLISLLSVVSQSGQRLTMALAHCRKWTNTHQMINALADYYTKMFRFIHSHDPVGCFVAAAAAAL